MIPVLAALLLALAIYYPAEFFQHHFCFQNSSAKISIQKVRNYLPVCKPNVSIEERTIADFINESVLKGADRQFSIHKEKDIISGFV